MRLIFFGTPTIAETVLRELEREHEIVAVYTQPDAIRGRGKTLMPSPVKAFAEDAGYPVFTPKSLTSDEVLQHISSLAPDAICVVAYGKIVPKSILSLPKYGCLNLHTSLLPRWRGAAPIARAILNGDEITGVCVMKMEEGLDTGPIYDSKNIEIGHLTADELEDALAHIGARSMLEVLEQLDKGTAHLEQQCEEGVLYAEKIMKNELFIDSEDSASSIERKVRASSTAHPSKINLAGKNVTLEKVAIAEEGMISDEALELAAKEARYIGKHLYLGSVDGIIEVLQVRPDGKKSMDAAAFIAGVQGAKNSILNWGNYEQH